MTNQPPVMNGKRKALIIGISKYDHSNKFQNLDFCENDANEVCKILKAQEYDIPENRLLVERVEWAKMREEVIKFFTDRTLKQEDTLFFYFSGHGYLDRNTNRTFLSTSEIDPAWPALKAIPFEELTTYINDSNSERIVAVLDSCYSGALEVGGKSGVEEGEEEIAKSEKGEEIASLANTNLDRTVKRLIKSGQGKCVLASSLEEQKSFKMEGQPYSTFTYFLIEGLKGVEGESVDSNGDVTPELLGSYVNKKMEELPRVRQRPIRKIEVTGQIILAHYPHLANRKDYLLHLLSEGKIDEFNEIRKRNNYSRLDLYDVDLGGKELSNADLRNSDLNLAILARSKLQHAVFSEANLIAANLEDANLSFADLSKTNLSKANLTYAYVPHANLSEAKLSETWLVQANLSDVNFSNAGLVEADLTGADLSKANLEGANLSDAKLIKANLTGANLSKAKLENAKLENANLTGVNFSGAVLSSVNLSSLDLSKANLEKANLSGADLSGADLVEANLLGADLSGADLSEARLMGADLSGADLSEATIGGAYLSFSMLIGIKVGNSKDNASVMKSMPRCYGSNLNFAVIDDKLLYECFRKGKATSLPRRIRDKKELREVLEKRGFDKEIIDRYLSLSSLPETSR